MMIYSPPDDDETVNLWTRDALISVREFEKDVRQDEDYGTTCIAR